MSRNEVPVESIWSGPGFETLVEIHSASLYSYFARRVRNVDAEDLLCETWLMAYDSRASFDPGKGSVRGWLFGVARHRLYRHYEWLAKQEDISIAARKVAPANEEDWAAIADRLDAVDMSGRLREALRTLPVSEREMLLLLAWEGLSPSEAAQVLGIPAATARTRLHRARQRMRERL